MLRAPDFWKSMKDVRQWKGSSPPRRQGTVNFERLGSLIPPPRERQDLVASPHHSCAGAGGSALRRAERERSRTLTPPNTQTPKAPTPHFSLPSPLQLSPTCLLLEPPHPQQPPQRDRAVHARRRTELGGAAPVRSARRGEQRPRPGRGAGGSFRRTANRRTPCPSSSLRA